MGDIETKIQELLKEMQEIKESQKVMTEKVSKMEQIMEHIENDIYCDEGFDFEIVCPYCEYEFVIDADDDKHEVECPKCQNLIELDWSGDLEEGNCSGHCHGCSGCDEDDDM